MPITIIVTITMKAQQRYIIGTESEAMVMNRENRASHCFEDPKLHFEENFVGSYIIAVYTTTYIAAASKQ